MHSRTYENLTLTNHPFYLMLIKWTLNQVQTAMTPEFLADRLGCVIVALAVLAHTKGMWDEHYVEAELVE